MMSGTQRKLAERWDESMTPYHWASGAATRLAWGETVNSGGGVHPAGRWDYAGPEPRQAWHMRRIAQPHTHAPQKPQGASSDESCREGSDACSAASDSSDSGSSNVESERERGRSQEAEGPDANERRAMAERGYAPTGREHGNPNAAATRRGRGGAHKHRVGNPGATEGARKARDQARGRTMQCLRCGMLVHCNYVMMVKGRQRKLDNQTAVSPRAETEYTFETGCGCGNTTCTTDFRPEQFIERQQERVEQLEAGTRTLVAWPESLASTATWQYNEQKSAEAVAHVRACGTREAAATGTEEKQEKRRRERQRGTAQISTQARSTQHDARS
jgi:hypothetical protein